MADGTPHFTLTISGLRKAFGRRVICDGGNLTLETGQAVAIVGPNGSGKSTMVRMIAGLTRPDAGKIVHTVDGTEIAPAEWHNHIGLVSPELALYEELSGFENLEFANHVGGWGKSRATYETMLDEVGLAGRGHDIVGAYSSGMKQRLKYAVALLKEPAILMLDEPTANLDVDGTARVWAALEHRRVALIIATNEPEEAERAQSRFVVGE